MVRRPVEPDPSTWWDRYGHRVRPRRAEDDGAGLFEPDGPVDADPASSRAALTAAELAGDAILRRRPDEPTSGWRRGVLRLSGGLVNPGPGRAERHRRDLVHRIRRPLPRAHRIAVTSTKGGVGKTTVTALLGLVLAETRGDRVVALDASPDAGTLADRLTGESAVTVRELVRDVDRIRSWTEVSRYTSLAGRLQVLASEQDPAAGAAFSRADYQQVCGVLERFFDIILTDSGTGLVHPAVSGTLELAHGLVVVGAPTVDGAGRASRTLDRLHAHGHGALAAEAVAVLSGDRASPDIDLPRIRAHFAARCRAVVELPHDPHLASGGRIELARLRPATRDAAVELAALMADGFAPPERPTLEG